MTDNSFTMLPEQSHNSNFTEKIFDANIPSVSEDMINIEAISFDYDNELRMVEPQNKSKKIVIKIDTGSIKTNNCECCSIDLKEENKNNFICYQCINCRLIYANKYQYVDHMRMCSKSLNISMRLSVIAQIAKSVSKDKATRVVCLDPITKKIKTNKEMVYQKMDIQTNLNLNLIHNRYNNGKTNFNEEATHEKQFKNENLLSNFNDLTSSSINEKAFDDFDLQHSIFGFATEETISENCPKNKKENIWYQCIQCGYITTIKCNYEKHLRIHSGFKPYSCKNCDYKCSDASHLWRHNKIHNNGKPYTCLKCKFKSSTQRDLKVHLKTNHIVIKPHLCEKCNYESYILADFKKHKRLHRRKFKHKCEKCDYKTNNNIHFDRHIITHTTDKNFKCNFCQYKTYDLFRLEKHARIHTDIKPFSCDQCSYKCRDKADLNKHNRKHSGERPYACDFCNYRSMSNSGLKKHCKIHIKKAK